MRKNVGVWLNSALLHGIVILLLWFPQPLHFPTRADAMMAWKNTALYFERILHPDEFEQAMQATQAAAQKRIADLPPALVARAKPLNKVLQISCPKDARIAQLHGSVFLIADIDAQGKVGKVAVIEASPNAQVNQRIVQSFTKARFQPAIDVHQKPALDQIHFTWPYDCRK
jgi:TonB family protein